MTVGKQAFAANPRPVDVHGARYRDDEEDVYYANIHFDKRVRRGGNYSRPEQGAAPQHGSPFRMTRARRRKKEPAIEPFSIELPKPERLPVDLLSHLVEKAIPKQHNSESAQTDLFKRKPADPGVGQKKTGVDAATHIPEGELFHFDIEVTPLLEVLVTKTLEQASMEIEEEAEMAAMESFKQEWLGERIRERRIEEDAVDEERIRHAATQKIKRARVALREDEIRHKILCQHASRIFLKDLCANALRSVREDGGLLQEKDKMEVETVFMPWLHEKILANVSVFERNAQIVNALGHNQFLERCETHIRVMAHLKVGQKKLDEEGKVAKQRQKELEIRKAEEAAEAAEQAANAAEELVEDEAA